MKLKWKRLWIKALRSGKFKQASGKLRRGGAYCCLGVLCKIVDPKKPWENDNNSGLFSFEGETCYPPTRILKQVGLRRSSMSKLAVMNDEGASFAQIAAHISRYR